MNLKRVPSLKIESSLLVLKAGYRDSQKRDPDTGMWSNGGGGSTKKPKTTKPTESKEFKSWFGESKVVGEDGEPLVVYHGTDQDFDEFDDALSIGGQHWFTSDRSKIEKGEVGASGTGKIKDVYLSLKNPAGWDEYDKYVLDELISLGYDGLMLIEDDQTTFVAFDPKQIKSTDNEGTWNPDDPRLTKSISLTNFAIKAGYREDQARSSETGRWTDSGGSATKKPKKDKESRKPYKWKPDGEPRPESGLPDRMKGDFKGNRYKFEVEDGRIGEVDIYEYDLNPPAEFDNNPFREAQQQGRVMEMHFAVESVGEGGEMVGEDFVPEMEMSTSITRGGDARRIFSTVLDVAKESIKKNKPDIILVHAEKEYDANFSRRRGGWVAGSRISLYEKFIERYMDRLGYTYDGRRVDLDNGRVVRMTLTRVGFERYPKGHLLHPDFNKSLSLTNLGLKAGYREDQTRSSETGQWTSEGGSTKKPKTTKYDPYKEESMGFVRSGSAYDITTGKEFEVIKNPTPQTLNELQSDATLGIRGWITGEGDLVAWDVVGGLHYDVQKLMGEDWKEWGSGSIPIYFSVQDGFIGVVVVTDSSERTRWHENPETAEAIKDALHLWTDPSWGLDIGYYNEAIVGDWEDLPSKSISLTNFKLKAGYREDQQRSSETGQWTSEGGSTKKPKTTKPTESKEFKEWFGESKLLDHEGNPRIMRHGSNSTDFSGDFAFDPKAIGSGHDEGYYGRGYYFVWGRGEASYYGKNVGNFYLKMENPYELGSGGGTIQDSFLHWTEKFEKLDEPNLFSDKARKTLSVHNELMSYMDENATISEMNKGGFVVEVDHPTFGKESSWGQQKWIDGKLESVGHPTVKEAKLHVANRYIKDLGWKSQSERDDGSGLAFPKLAKYEGVEYQSLTDYMRTAEHPTKFDIDVPRTHSMASQLTHTLKERGYDGIIVGDLDWTDRGGKEPMSHYDEVVVFDPSQIKSADNNEGSFDPNDPRVNKSLTLTNFKLKAGYREDQARSSETGRWTGGGGTSAPTKESKIDKLKKLVDTELEGSVYQQGTTPEYENERGIFIKEDIDELSDLNKKNFGWGTRNNEIQGYLDSYDKQIPLWMSMTEDEMGAMKSYSQEAFKAMSDALVGEGSGETSIYYALKAKDLHAVISRAPKVDATLYSGVNPEHYSSETLYQEVDSMWNSMIPEGSQGTAEQQVEVTKFVASQIENHFRSKGFDSLMHRPKRFFSMTTSQGFAKVWSAGSTTQNQIGTGRLPDTVIRIKKGVNRGLVTRPFMEIKSEFEVIGGAYQTRLVFKGVEIDESSNTIYIDMYDMDKEMGSM